MPTLIPVAVPDLDEVRANALTLHQQGQAWQGEAFSWEAEYNPESPEPPFGTKMSFTPADFCIGDSSIWFFSLMWEAGKKAPPVEFLDDTHLLEPVFPPSA